VQLGLALWSYFYLGVKRTWTNCTFNLSTVLYGLSIPLCGKTVTVSSK